MESKRILIVDDNEADRINLQQIVAAAKHQTFLASNGAEALAAARKEKPHMVLMDIIMADMDGFRACREMHNDPALAGIPVVFVSSKNQRADHMWAAKQGAKALVSKPYQSQQIVEQIERYA